MIREHHDSPSQVAHPDERPVTIALLPWGNVIEEFLDTIGLSLEAFCNEFTGSYMFRYIEALRQVGVRTVLICVSARVSEPARFTHRPTGATIHLLPALRIHRLLRWKMVRPFGPEGRTVREAFGELRGPRCIALPVLAVAKEVVLYLSTPLRLLSRILREEECSAILCQEYEYPRFDVCVATGRLLGLPVFATFQGGDYQRNHLERFLRPLALRACTGLIIATQSEIQRVQSRYGVSSAKIARIFNPVDVQLWRATDRIAARASLDIPLGARVVVWHGRISIWQKGLDILLDAWEQVCRERTGHDLRLLLVGSGEDADKLRRRLAGMQRQNVRWVNEFVHDRATIRRYLSAGDLYAFPSRHEGFPGSPLEAMACGLPVVAAAAQGVSDILEGGEASGGLIVPRDDPAALALALGRLLDDEGWACELGRRARCRVEACFSLEAVGKQLHTFLFKGRSEN
jgi:glycosyltransferase involved in cell wall biosynthesis